MAARAFGTGSSYLQNFLVPEQVHALQSLATSKYVDRNAEGMKYRNNPLRRQKRFFVAGGQPLTSLEQHRKFERYYYTGWTWASMLHYERIQNEPAILELTVFLSQLLKVKFNHVILTRYERDLEGKDDVIGFHYDKPKDLDPDAPIVILTLGDDLREFVVRDRKTQQEMFRVAPQPGSLLTMTMADNLATEHSIVSTSDEKILKRRKAAGCRMSIVFRKVNTLVTQREIDSHVQHYRKTVKLREKERESWFVVQNGKIVHLRKCSLCLSGPTQHVSNAQGKRFCKVCFSTGTNTSN